MDEFEEFLENEKRKNVKKFIFWMAALVSTIVVLLFATSFIISEGVKYITGP